jgi:Ca-activated chloride channel family protein
MRLAVVKRAAEEFVQNRVGDRIGLILFGTRAYLQTPLTYDRHSVLLRIEDATVGLAGNTTSIGDALGLAVKRLQTVPKEGRMIILLTDGVNNSGVLPPLKAAELARDFGIKVYTIGLGATVDPQSFGGMFFDMNVRADLDEETLKDVSKMTGGRYFRATDLNSLQKIYKIINQMETTSQEQASVRPQHDYYPWLLGFAIALFLYGLAMMGGLIPNARRVKRQGVISE